MAAVLEQQDAAVKNGSRVDEQIAQATSRIRTHDLMFGGLVLVALVLVYATAMILLDKYFNLSQWVRQVSLLGFVGAFAGVAYLTILSPLRKKINPLYAARQVENTIDDAKNSVTGYVDAQQNGNLNATVKAALARRAAEATTDADVNKAVDHRSLAWLGGVAIAFFLALVVLFFVFRPAQFASLVGRTFSPFSTTEIVTRTQLTVVKPEPANPTVTDGQSITVAVRIGGKVPNADSPERVRLMIRHNPADPNYTELPMVQGDTTRDWELRVPNYLVQNGFWYKVAGGDAETPEYKVTIRSLPRFETVQATYEYPKYLRRETETTNNQTPIIKGPRGTTVTLVARTNRDVRDGMMVLEPSNQRLTGALVPDEPKCLQFVFKLQDSGKYKLTFATADGERSTDLFQSTITVETDGAPILVITKPEDKDEPTEIPANGQLAIDGKVGDDYGIETITLKMRIVGTTERPLPDRPFLNGMSASFLREKDKSWPTDVDYKDSVDFAKLTKDAAGLALDLKPDTIIEYWLEATDNCTEPKANVGKSAVKRVRLTPPKMEPEDKQNLDKQKDDRKNEEKKHNADQQQKLDQEKREPRNAAQQPDKGDPKNEVQPDGKKNNTDPTGTPKDKGDNPGMPGDPMMDPMGKPPEAPMPKTRDEKELQKKAEAAKNEIDKENEQGGTAKPNAAPNPEDRANPAEQKPQPPMDNMGDMAQPKPDQKPDGMNPMPKNGANPADARPEGNVEKTADPSAPKPPPQGDQKGTAPSEPRDEPIGSPPGTDKPQPKEARPQPKDPNKKQDPNSGSGAKPATDKKDGEAGTPNATDKKDPAADSGSKAKPMPEQNRGGDKPDQPKGPPPADTKPENKPDAGDAKPNKAPPAAENKSKPADDKMPDGMNTETKPDGAGNGAAEAKPDDPKKPPMPGAGQGVEKGMEKPDPKDDKNPPKGGGNDAPKQKELTEKEREELKEAAKNLTDPDPKKQQDARDKLDKSIGKEKREEIEKLANDLNSPDEKTREEAKRKLEQMTKDAQKGGKPDNKGTKEDAPKPDPKQQKEIEDALKDLQSGDKDKQDAARQKLDKMVGEDKRKEAEQLMNDLQSKDMDKQAAAQKKLDDLKKELDKQTAGKKEDGKPKELTKEEIADLAKKAQDLQSMDDKTREKAQKELDEKIGQENRKKLEEEMKKQKPGDPEQEKKLKEELEKMAKERAKKEHDPKGSGLGTGATTKEAMEEDARNRLKTAELQLEQFEKKRYDEAFKKKQSFTDAEYEKFLRDYEKYVEKLRDDVKKGVASDKAPPPSSVEPGTAIPASAGGKVTPSAAPGSSGTGGGTTVEAPGFENLRDKFQKLINEKK